MKTTDRIILVLGLFLGVTAYSQGQTEVLAKPNQDITQNEKSMKTYLIEREIPEAGKLTPEQLKGISQKSCAVLEEMDAEIEWLHSYVTDDKVYCLYRAENKELIRAHSKRGGFPANQINEVSTNIGPMTAKE